MPLKNWVVTHSRVAQLFGEVIGQPAGELEHRLGGDIFADQRGGAFPADFDAGKQVGLRAGELEQAGGLELGVLAEDLAVGDEADGGAAPVGGAAEALQRAGGQPLGELLRPQLLVPRDFDPRVAGQCVDHRDADAVEAAAGGIGLAGELAARMQRGQDHFQRRFAGIFGVLVDRDAAAVVADRKAVALLQRHFDPRGVAGDRLVHRIVEHFGGEVVQRALVGAADIHAGAAADRLQPLQHFDGAAVIGVAIAEGQGFEEIVRGFGGHGNGYRTPGFPRASGGDGYLQAERGDWA